MTGLWCILSYVQAKLDTRIGSINYLPFLRGVFFHMPDKKTQTIRKTDRMTNLHEVIQTARQPDKKDSIKERLSGRQIERKIVR